MKTIIATLLFIAATIASAFGQAQASLACLTLRSEFTIYGIGNYGVSVQL